MEQSQDIPCLTTSGRTLAEAYENAMLALHEYGRPFKTQYDKPGDPPSIDATMDIVVDEPMTDPMIHKGFPGGIEDLREYVMELQGVKDNWCKNMNDPDDKRWEYTYHGRFRRWGQWKEAYHTPGRDVGAFNVDQIEYVIEKLIKQPFTRQAQMITWMPNLDLTCFDPPCLQSMWFRVIVDERGVWWLNSNLRIRSNDAWGASFMNMFGLIMFIRENIADEIVKRAKVQVEMARFHWHADSYHIYGKDIKQFEGMMLGRIDSSPFESRVMNFYDSEVQSMYNEATEKVHEKIARYAEEHP